MKVGDKVAWDFHGFKGEGVLDRIDGLRYYIRPSVPIPSYSMLKFSPSTIIGEWPFVVVMEDQARAL